MTPKLKPIKNLPVSTNYLYSCFKLSQSELFPEELLLHFLFSIRKSSVLSTVVVLIPAHSLTQGSVPDTVGLWRGSSRDGRL